MQDVEGPHSVAVLEKLGREGRTDEPRPAGDKDGSAHRIAAGELIGCTFHSAHATRVVSSCSRPGTWAWKGVIPTGPPGSASTGTPASSDQRRATSAGARRVTP